MKKILIAGLLLLFAAGTYAQRFHGGIMAGGVASQVQGDDYGGFNKLGLYGGAFVGLDVGEFSTLQMEMAFIQKGSRQNSDPENGIYDSYLLRLNYFEVPFLYQVHFLKRLTFEAGPAMDVLISSYEEKNEMEVENDVPLRNVTLNGLAGVSCDITSKLKADFRFIGSITSARTNKWNGFYKRFGVWGQYNDLLAFTLWYKIK